MVFNDSVEQNSPHRSLSGITRGYSEQILPRRKRRRLAFFTGNLFVNIRVLFVLNPKPVLLDNFILVSAIEFPLLSFLNFGTYINITCESSGSSLAIFACVFLNCAPPL